MGDRTKKNTFVSIIIASILLITVNAISLISDFRIDLTGTGEFSLKPQTKQLLDSLTQPVELFILRPTEGIDANITLLLESYTAYSKQITVTELDTALHPDTVIQLSGYSAVVPGTIFARSAGFVSSAPPDSFYKYAMDYTTMQRYTSLFCGESIINGLIATAIGNDMSILYILEGHKEEELEQDFLTQLRQEGISVAKLNLLKDVSMETTGINAAVLIYAPKQDITPAEADALLHMSDAGISLLLVSQYTGEHHTNIARLADAFGFIINEGILNEKNSTFTAQNNSMYLRPLIHSHLITDGVIEQKKPVIVPAASGLSLVPRNSVMQKALLTVSETAELVTASGERTSAPHTPIAAAAERDTGSKMVLITGSGILDETVDRLLTAGGNNIFAMNSISWLAGRADSWSVPSTDATLKYTSFTSQQINRYSLLIAVVIPLFCFFIAAFIRKRRKSR